MGEANRRDVESALRKKGFRQSNGSHRKFVFYTCGGKKTSVWTEISHGSKHRDLSEFILPVQSHCVRQLHPLRKGGAGVRGHRA